MNDHCTETRDRFSAALDGGLTPEQRGAFEAHLQNCERCRADWRLFAGTVGILRKMSPEPMSDLGKARLRKRLQSAYREERSGTWRGLQAATGGLSVAAVLLLTVGATLMLQSRPPTAGVQQAMEDPSPQLRLRDAATGGWMDVESLAALMKRNQRAVAVVPRLRTSYEAVSDRLGKSRRQVRASLARHGVDPEAVSFLSPVTVDGNLLRGPELELWVEQLPRKQSVRFASAP